MSVECALVRWRNPFDEEFVQVHNNVHLPIAIATTNKDLDIVRAGILDLEQSRSRGWTLPNLQRNDTFKDGAKHTTLDGKGTLLFALSLSSLPRPKPRTGFSPHGTLLTSPPPGSCNPQNGTIGAEGAEETNRSGSRGSTDIGLLDTSFPRDFRHETRVVAPFVTVGYRVGTDVFDNFRPVW